MEEKTFVPLAEELRQLMNESLISKEIENLTEILKEAARNGQASVLIDDLMQVVPQMLMSGKFNDWIEKNGLATLGGVAADGKYRYTISW